MKKGFYVLLALCVIMLALYVGKERMTDEHNSEPVSFVIDVIPQELNVDELTQVMISHNGSVILLGYWQEEWIVQTLLGAKARVDLIQDLVMAVNDLEGELRSDEPAFLPDYEIDDANAIRFTFRREDIDILEMLVARKRQGMGNFVRLKDSNKVYAVQNDFLDALGLTDRISERQLDSQPWVDQQLLELDPEQIVAVTIDGQGQRVLDIVKNQDGVWQFTNDYVFDVDQQRIQKYLQMIAQQRVYKVDQASAIGMDEVDWVFNMTLDDGQTIKLTRKALDGIFYIRVNDKPYVREMSPYHFDNFHNNDWDVFEKK